MLREILLSHGLSSRFGGHKPKFRLEEAEGQGTWIYDGGIQVGFVPAGQAEAELLNHDPAQAKTFAFPPIYHAPTQMGDRITLVPWVAVADGVKRDHYELTMKANGSWVSASTEERWSDGRHTSCRVTWSVDKDFGYRMQAQVEMSFEGEECDDVLQEFCNFLPRGVTDDRPESGRRYPYVLWQHPDGNILRWNQNNVGARTLGAMDHFDQRKVMTGGFMGFFGESDYNPVVEILEANPGVTAVTCPNMLDEHLLWLPPENNGLKQYRAVYNMVRVPGVVSEELTARAQMIAPMLDCVDTAREQYNRVRLSDYPYEQGEPYSMRFYPISQGEVCDFETPIDPTATFWGQVFPYRENSSSDKISVVSDQAHSGSRSLRVRVNGESLRAFAIGCCLHVTQGQCYRLSAWVKCALTEGTAELLAMEYLFGRENVTAEHRQAALNIGEWQPLAVEFTPGEKAHVVDICFDVAGRGQAWIDDILLERVGEEG